MQVNKSNSEIALKFDNKEFHWKQSESLLTRLEAEGVVKLIFPLHGTLILILFMFIFSNYYCMPAKTSVADEIKRKQLLRNWALNWLEFTWQPIDEIYSYFGTKVELCPVQLIRTIFNLCSILSKAR